MAMMPPCYLSRNLDGKSTELLVQTFADRVLVLVTQMGKVGTLIQATIPPTISLPSTSALDPSNPYDRSLPPPPAAIQLTPLLGSAQTLYALYTAQIATIIWTKESQGSLEASRRSVVVGLALRKSDNNGGAGLTESEKTVFHGVMSMLQDLLSQYGQD